MKGNGSSGMRSLASLAGLVIASFGAFSCGEGDDQGAPTLSPLAEDRRAEASALEYAEAKGAEACAFVSDAAIERVGGIAQCADQLDERPSATFEPEGVQIDGTTAQVDLTNTETDKVLKLELVSEQGVWKVSEAPELKAPAAPVEPETAPSTDTETLPNEAAPEEEVAPETGAPETSP